MDRDLEQKHYDALVEHLAYEIDMLRSAYFFLFGEAQHKIEGSAFLKNAAIEVFWLHARCLLEFFRRESQSEGRTACANDFTRERVAYELPYELEEQINNQICHLNYDRFRDSENKIGGYTIVRVKESLDRAINLFENTLTEDAEAYWVKRPDARITFPSNVQFSATNAISATGLQFSTTTSTLTSFKIVPDQTSYTIKVGGDE